MHSSGSAALQDSWTAGTCSSFIIPPVRADCNPLHYRLRFMEQIAGCSTIAIRRKSWYSKQEPIDKVCPSVFPTHRGTGTRFCLTLFCWHALNYKSSKIIRRSRGPIKLWIDAVHCCHSVTIVAQSLFLMQPYFSLKPVDFVGRKECAFFMQQKNLNEGSGRYGKSHTGYFPSGR